MDLGLKESVIAVTGGGVGIGQGISRAWIRHSEIAAGGLLHFVMSSEPNKQWATRIEDLPNHEAL
jgi:hypothetical protein